MISDVSGGSAKAPLAVRMRPRNISEISGQEHLLKPGSPLHQLATDSVKTGQASVILWGPPGTGKTTIAQVIANTSKSVFVELSAVTAGVKDVRQVMQKALDNRDLYGTSTVLFLDEIHRFTKAQQDALLPGVENGWVTLIAATTENPSFSVISPLLSRSLLLTLNLLSEDSLKELVHRAISSERGLNGSVTISDDAVEAIVNLSSGDARRALTSLDAAASIAISSAQSGVVPQISPSDVATAVNRALLRYDKQGDQHYDVVSAFIKSMRGSDPDAAIHYLARMIEAGEDPRFIARRLIVHASEDVGMADPQALQVAVAAADAVNLVGLPEARIPLAQAVIYISTAAKSNSVYVAIDSALADVRAGKAGEVPKHLRDAHYLGAKALGHGKGYKYPHDSNLGVVAQQYMPKGIEGQKYYEPSTHGKEKEILERLSRIRKIQKPK